MNHLGRRRERAKRAVAEGDASPSAGTRSCTSLPEGAPPARLYLASASPRRARLLREAGLDFVPRPVDVDETPPSTDPRATVLALARRKADAAALGLAEGLVLAADTLVALDGRLLGKPASAAEAGATLRALSGRAHDVWTGVCVLRVRDGARFETAERARVVFRALGEDEIAAYVATGEPMDKAGAYGVQGGAAAFVERVEGDATTVVGLPVEATRRLLEAAKRS